MTLYEDIRLKLKEKIGCPIKDVISYELLTNPEYFKLLIQECGVKIEGEKETIKTILLCAAGRLVENCNLASYNLMVNDESGTGKDFITNNVLKLMPKPIVEKRSRISEKAFTYWHDPKYEPEWTWDGKVCYLEDVSNTVLNSDVFKVMCSSGSNTTIVKDGRTIDIEIKGKPVIIITSANTLPKNEVIRRFTIVNLDGSTDQTRAIMKKKAIAATKGETLDYDERLIKTFNYLKRVKVKIPYAEKIPNLMPDNLIMRTAIDRFFDYIKASAAIYQYQRDKENGFIIANGIDYDNALEVLIKTTSNQYMIPLTKQQQAIIDVLKINNNWTSVNELTSRINMSDKWLRIQLSKLVEMGIIERDSIEKGESKKLVTVYHHKDIYDLKLPKWSELK